ncbi:MAG: sugar phosphate nucleotidyltransferase [Candidatus Beckwithbacteria bacterium]|nr:NTP transferase domain-containing protein [Patescibacteria group bacterium]
MKNITAIILAAGEGKRLKPLITPKGLLSFLGKSMVSWHINDLNQAGIDNIIVVVSLKAKKEFESKLPSSLKIVVQKNPNGMADALLSASPFIKTKSTIIINGSDLLSISAISDFVKHIKVKHPNILLSGLKLDYYLPGGYFKLENKKPLAIIEKPGEGNQPSPYFNIVLHYFKDTKTFINTLKTTKSKQDDIYEKALSKLMADGQVNMFEYQDYFAQIKYPHQILDMVDLFLTSRLDKKSAIHPTAKIMSGAVIKNSYIGKNVVVGNNALIRDSIIEEGSVVGYNTEIARSYVGPKSFFHCNYVGDSVIEGSTNMGSGSRLANLRFDEKEIGDTGKKKFGAVLAHGAKLGINASIMPGAMIKANQIVGSGVVYYAK